MGKGTGYRDISNIEADCAEGLLFCGWTNKWGVKVYPWYEKDLVTFAFIEKGKQGKGKSFDVSVPAKKNYIFDFADFAHEILHDVRTPYDFVSVMKSEREQGEQYPKRYRFSSGSDGEKSLGFCNSNLDGGEYCLNASAVKDGKKVIVNMPMSYYDVYELAEAFVETYKDRHEKLKKIRTEGIIARGERIKATTQRNVDDINVTTTEGVQSQPDGTYTVSAVTTAGEKVTIRFLEKTVDRLSAERKDCFPRFCQMAENKPVEFRFSGEKICRNGTTEYIFERFGQKS